MHRHHSTHPRVAASRAHEETLPLFAWAISRPDNHQPLIGPHACGDCSFFVDKKRGGGLCGKYRQLMLGVDGPRLPSTAPCCRFFEPAQS